MESKWTRFMDMHSGGPAKLEYEYVYINAPLEEAKRAFELLFERNPENETCACCGEDYSISEYDSLAQATAYDRNCTWDYDKKCYDESTGTPLELFLRRATDSVFVRSAEFTHLLGE